MQQPARVEERPILLQMPPLIFGHTGLRGRGHFFLGNSVDAVFRRVDREDRLTYDLVPLPAEDFLGTYIPFIDNSVRVLE